MGKLPEKRQTVEQDVNVLIVTAAGASGAASGLMQRYVFNNQSNGLRLLYAASMAVAIWLGRSPSSTHGVQGYEDAYDKATGRASMPPWACEITFTVAVAIVTFNLTSPRAREPRLPARPRTCGRAARARAPARRAAAVARRAALERPDVVAVAGCGGDQRVHTADVQLRSSRCDDAALAARVVTVVGIQQRPLVTHRRRVVVTERQVKRLRRAQRFPAARCAVAAPPSPPRARQSGARA